MQFSLRHPIGPCVHRWTQTLAALLTVWAIAPLSDHADAAEGDAKPALKSGPKVGTYMPSFYTRAVTGPLMNKSVCYVCRNGQRPVVLLLMRRVHPELKPLLKRLDRLINDNRANGLRGFGVLINSDSTKAISAVQTFAFNHKITLPLTVAGESIAAEGHQNVPDNAALTVVLYRRRKVVATYPFRAGELKPTDIQHITKHIKRLMSDAADNTGDNPPDNADGTVSTR